MKLQQYTGPVQAKGLEDTAFYRYNVLLSLNEVGGDPARFGRSVEEFHEANALRASQWPFEMLDDRHARHEARRGRPRADQRDLGDAGRVGARGRAVDADQSCRTIARPWRARARPRRRIPLLPGARRRVARGTSRGGRRDRRAGRADPAALRIHDQGGEGSQGAYELADAEPAVRGCARAVRDRGPQRSAGCAPARRVSAVPAAHRVARHDQLARAGDAEDRLPACRTSTRARSCGISAWSIPTIAARSTSSCARACWTTSIGCWRRIGRRCRASEIAAWMANWTDGRIKLLVTAAGLRARRELPHVFLGGGYLPLATEVTVPAGAVAFARTSDAGRSDAGRRRALHRAAPVRVHRGRGSRGAARRRVLENVPRDAAGRAPPPDLPRCDHRRRDPPDTRGRIRLDFSRRSVLDAAGRDTASDLSG